MTDSQRTDFPAFTEHRVPRDRGSQRSRPLRSFKYSRQPRAGSALKPFHLAAQPPGGLLSPLEADDDHPP